MVRYILEFTRVR